ncbi:S-methyl-5-thioribose-1-phosphate isomerase [Agyrium rufum]|nr:S-methyl-5-thioribose-1-phosphate isomerase [Agyrium rufum]
MVLEAIVYKRGSLRILDQLDLPHQEVYKDITSVEQAWESIKSMRVRGAPAIAIVAALSLAVELTNERDLSKNLVDEGEHDHIVGYTQSIKKKLDYLVTSRPTAVNLADAARKLTKVVEDATQTCKEPSAVRDAYVSAAERMLVGDVSDNQNIGRHGADWILKHSEDSSVSVSVLTHCNTGSLATAGYGTALGVIRSLHAKGTLKQAFYCETRPYNQGSRLTGYELIHDGIPTKMITDSMAATLMRLKGSSENIIAVVVGADRVAANGDTANKIGTYALAILARHHGVKFLVAAPRTTIDLNTATGTDIAIEERSPTEMTVMRGPVITDGKVDITQVVEVSIAAKGTQAWNPAFDVTPADLIDGIVTEVGVVEKGPLGAFDLKALFGIEDTKSRLNGEQKDMPDPVEGP